ncbi:MAG TPA: 3-phosphoshikimate 1-carboxyvinyltransferase [Candidatus Omnitrophota bacterium]|nr:3-phosphoshikimate 1-carboxyvinyltransferase [Candidatus Omnitrophota bacterium]HPD84019.1 3-phosphoshikimate 1-carboxyvinyltransferase [Candidatus Omnitrophota bacterium]HRZ02876.1 3-phosphoshikimate 1-carboxyvinyltransferase [Candidatus Omnitrophota bacterium]
MILTVRPADYLKGHIDLPASKSYTIRAILIAACGGVSKIINLSSCDDANVARKVARVLGARMISARNKKDILRISAVKKMPESVHVDVGESGTVLRFLLPLLVARGSAARVTGQGTLRSRPNTHLVKALRGMGADIKGRGPGNCVPITIGKGTVRGGKISIDGTLSSQFISALLIACPFLKSDTSLAIKGKKIVSATYVTMTRQVLKHAGINIVSKGQRSFFIKGNQRFKGLRNFVVPSDYGLAAFLLAAAALTKSNLILTGSLKDSLIQSDGEILPLLRRMGVKFVKSANRIRISGPSRLKGGSFSLKNCPDLVPIVSVMALFARGKTRLYDIAHVRSKESDRISDLRKELLKLGAKVKETKNELIIYPRPNYKKNVFLDPHHDHRLAMSFCIAGLKLGVRVKDIECVAKSYPSFTQDLKSAGACLSRN